MTTLNCFVRKSISEKKLCQNIEKTEMGYSCQPTEQSETIYSTSQPSLNVSSLLVYLADMYTNEKGPFQRCNSLTVGESTQLYFYLRESSFRWLRDTSSQRSHQWKTVSINTYIVLLTYWALVQSLNIISCDFLQSYKHILLMSLLLPIKTEAQIG